MLKGRGSNTTRRSGQFTPVLAAANDTRQQLEDKISRLRVELDRRPQVTEAQNLAHPLPSTDTADGTLSHTSLQHILEQQQAMMVAQLTALNNLVEASSSHRRPADFRSSGDNPTASATSRPWKLDIPTLQAPEDTDLSDLRRLADALGGLRRPDEGHGRRADDDRSPGSSPLRSSPEWTVLWQGTPGHRPRRRHRRNCRETGSLPPPLSKPSARPQGLFQPQPGGTAKNIDQYVSALVRIHNRCWL